MGACDGAQHPQACRCALLERVAIHCSAGTRPCSRMAGRRLCMMRWLASMARVSPGRLLRSRRPRRWCGGDPGEVELEGGQGLPPTSSWISRRSPRAPCSMLVCRCWASSDSRWRAGLFPGRGRRSRAWRVAVRPRWRAPPPAPAAPGCSSTGSRRRRCASPPRGVSADPPGYQDERDPSAGAQGSSRPEKTGRLKSDRTMSQSAAARPELAASVSTRSRSRPMPARRRWPSPGRGPGRVLRCSTRRRRGRRRAGMPWPQVCPRRCPGPPIWHEMPSGTDNWKMIGGPLPKMVQCKSPGGPKVGDPMTGADAIRGATMRPSREPTL